MLVPARSSSAAVPAIELLLRWSYLAARLLWHLIASQVIQRWRLFFFCSRLRATSCCGLKTRSQTRQAAVAAAADPACGWAQRSARRPATRAAAVELLGDGAAAGGAQGAVLISSCPSPAARPSCNLQTVAWVRSTLCLPALLFSPIIS